MDSCPGTGLDDPLTVVAMIVGPGLWLALLLYYMVGEP